jgi:hypothetical protein
MVRNNVRPLQGDVRSCSDRRLERWRSCIDAAVKGVSLFKVAMFHNLQAMPLMVTSFSAFQTKLSLSLNDHSMRFAPTRSSILASRAGKLRHFRTAENGLKSVTRLTNCRRL